MYYNAYWSHFFITIYISLYCVMCFILGYRRGPLYNSTCLVMFSKDNMENVIASKYIFR